MEILLLIIAALLLIIIVAVSQLRNDIKRTNLTLDKIAQKIGVPNPAGDDNLITLIREDKKIEAIKRYREITGAGLKEAADYIERLMQQRT